MTAFAIAACGDIIAPAHYLRRDAGDGGGTIEAEEHTDASAPGEVTPPPLSPEGDAIP